MSRKTFLYYRDWMQLKSCFRRLEDIADQLGIDVDRLHEFNRPFSIDATPAPNKQLANTRMHVYREFSLVQENPVF